MMTSVDGSNFGSIACIASVVLAVEIIKWSRVTEGKISLLQPVNFKNYKFLILVIIISSLLSGLLCNSIISYINSSITIDVLTVLRFMVGDLLGASAVLISMWIIFSTITDTRLIVSNDN
ncbi:MAG: hypothetical protein CBD86_02805 [Gammaproteobacteria bacterium TMED226]|nr:MAG: hypothetical protein CBD86_02805 [Gammaproteobacteria bacterium TMED226]